ALVDRVVDAEPVGLLVVAEVVLDVGEYLAGLDRLDVPDRELAGQVRVLAVPLEGPAVGRYPGDVDGRALQHVAADRQHLLRLEVAVRGRLPQVPGRGERDRGGQRGRRWLGHPAGAHAGGTVGEQQFRDAEAGDG